MTGLRYHVFAPSPYRNEDDPPPIDEEREAWMAFQHTWLQSPYARHLKRMYGLDHPFRPDVSQITLRDVRKRPLPNWHPWMRRNTEYDMPHPFKETPNGTFQNA